MAARPKLPSVYSATLTHESGRVEHRYVCDDKHRTETVSVGTRPLIVIRRSDLGVVWAIHPEDHIYFESKIKDVDANAAKLFPPLEIAWTELRGARIDGRLYRHFRGIGQTRHGRGEEHIYIDPESGMFRREHTRLRGIRSQIDYSNIDLSRPKDELFDFDRKGYKKGRT
jgi:hypothetical protein